MHTDSHKNGAGNYQNFKSIPVPNTPAGSKVSDIFGELDRAWNAFQTLPGVTPELSQSFYTGMATLIGVSQIAASAKGHSNA